MKRAINQSLFPHTNQQGNIILQGKQRMICSGKTSLHLIAICNARCGNAKHLDKGSGKIAPSFPNVKNTNDIAGLSSAIS